MALSLLRRDSLVVSMAVNEIDAMERNIGQPLQTQAIQIRRDILRKLFALVVKHQRRQIVAGGHVLRPRLIGEAA